ncbi:MAG: aminoacyl-tRNA hydrolase, partial [Alphaproteobacteria bacterium]|nr:aminoacyl-tRNA hydrolase [Alphaproteobacteria bacterium]
GLGNPGPDYALNRHNIGFMAADQIVRRHRLPAWRSRFSAEMSDGELAGERVVVLKPMTYMNDSGSPVAAAARFFKIPVGDIIVLHDEIDLAPGKVRVKTGGGVAGHNGLRSIDDHLGPDFMRVRIGVGHPGDPDRVADYVLSDFSKAEIRDWVEKLVAAIADQVPLLLEGNDSGFMSKAALALQPPRAAAAQKDTKKDD